MTGLALAEVLAEHWEIDVDNGGDQTEFFCDGCKETLAIGAGRDVDELHRAHVAAAVTAWLAERLASDEVREAAREAVMDAWSLNVAERNGWDTAAAHGRGMSDAALAAVVGALAGEGNADSAPEAAKTAPVSDRGPKSGQGDHRDDEGRSGAQEEGK